MYLLLLKKEEKIQKIVKIDDYYFRFKIEFKRKELIMENFSISIFSLK